MYTIVCSCSSYAECFAKESRRCVDSDKMVLLNSSYIGLHPTSAGNELVLLSSAYGH